MIQAKVIEVEKPKRPRLYCGVARTGKGPEWFVVLMVPDEVRFNTLLGRDPQYEELTFIIPGSGEDDMLTEEKVRETAEKFVRANVGMTYSDEVEPFVAFARELGVIDKESNQ